MRFNPREYQALGIDFVMKTARANLFAQPGLGKTVMTLTGVDKLRLVDEIDKTLVIAPTRVIETEGWTRELGKWDHLRDLDIEPITGTQAQRRAKLHSPKPIHLINYELIPWLLDELIVKGHWPYDMVVPDESTKLKKYNGVWFMGHLAEREGKKIIKAATPGLKHAATRTKRWLNLTGTPTPNGVQDLWSQTYLLDGGRRLHHNITAFRNVWMRPHPHIKNKWLEEPNALADVTAAIADISMSIKAKDWLPIADPVIVRRDVALPSELRDRYRALEREFFTRLDGHVIEAANSAVLGSKLRQFVSGAMYVERGSKEWAEVHRAKIDATRDLVEEIGQPVIIAYHFEFEAQRLKNHFKDAVIFDGKRKTIDAFAAGKIPQLILNPANSGHGVDGLQDGTDSLIFFSSDWNLENHDQAIERIGATRQLQSGHPRPPLLYYMTVAKTIDELLLERLAYKRDMQDILTNALRRYQREPDA